MTTPISELSWTLADYEAAEVEPPERIAANPKLTEGDMMTDDEVQAFIKDSIATLRILADRNSSRYEEIRANYYADLAFLAKISRLDEDEYEELVHPDNLSF